MLFLLNLENIIVTFDALNTQEKTIVELIQNIQNKSDSKPKSIKEDTEDLFGELMGKNENTVVMAPIEEDEINKENIKEALLDITKELDKIETPASHTDNLNIQNDEKEENDDEEKANMAGNQDKTDSIVADKSFYTNSLSFNKTDFEGFEDLEKNQKKGNLFAKIAITLIILMLLATIFLILNFLLDWNIF